MWLVVGGDSEVGAAVFRRLNALGVPASATTRRPDLVGPRRPFLDLASPLDHWDPPKGTQAACIAAAVARLADCAANPTASAAVNVTATLALADRLIARGVYVLFLSSNQVFDGTRPQVPPDAPTCPVSEYGRQKARTESVLKAHMDRGSAVGILRLAKVLSPTMPLLREWVGALAAGQTVRAFDDMVMAPTPADIVVDAIIALLKDGPRGTFQLTGPRDASYTEVGRYLAARIGADAKQVRSASAVGVGMPVGATPFHTTLDSTAFRTMYGVRVPDIWEAVESFLSASR